MITIVTATQEEMIACLSYVEHTVPTAILQNMQDGDTVHTRISGKKVLLIIVGVGPVNSAYYMGKNIVECKDSLLLHCGIAGTYDSNILCVGDICYIEEEVYSEYGRVAGDGTVEPLPYGHHASEQRTNRISFESVEDLLMKFSLHDIEMVKVKSLSMAGVSADSARAMQIQKQYPEAIVENMEGFSVGIAARKSGVEYIGIRSISNISGDKESWNIPMSFYALGKTIQKIFG